MSSTKNIDTNLDKYNKIYEVFSEDETIKIARSLAQNSQKNQIFCLTGDLGVGKTCFSKGFALGLGITEHITSPTFNIVNEYKNCNIPFFHFDVYRICDEDELFDIGYEEYFFGGGVCLIEWAELVKGLIPKDSTWVNISKDLSKGEDYRLIKINKN